MSVYHFVESQVEPHHRVLDLGCGSKQFASLLCKEYKTVDAWKEVQPHYVLDIGKQRLPFKDKRFDVVLMIDLVEHMTKEEGFFAIGEAKRVGVKIILLTPLWWDDNRRNTENPELWCFGNPFNYHKSLWVPEDFEGFKMFPYPNETNDPYYLGVWS